MTTRRAHELARGVDFHGPANTEELANAKFHTHARLREVRRVAVASVCEVGRPQRAQRMADSAIAIGHLHHGAHRAALTQHRRARGPALEAIALLVDEPSVGIERDVENAVGSGALQQSDVPIVDRVETTRYENYRCSGVDRYARQ